MAKAQTNTGNFRKPSTVASSKPKGNRQAFWKDPRFRISAGLLLLSIGLFLFFSFTSYLFTATADQSIVRGSDWQVMKEQLGEVKNALSLSGAYISYYFIYRWFGLGAFFLIPVLSLMGLKFIAPRLAIPLSRVFWFCFFALLWVAVLLGYVEVLGLSGSYMALLTGGVGFQLAALADAYMGYGTLLLLLVAGFIFLIYFFDIDEIPRFAFFKVKKSGSEADTDEQVQDGIKPFEKEQHVVRIPLEDTSEEEETDEVDDSDTWEIIRKEPADSKPDTTVTAPSSAREIEVEINEEPIPQQAINQLEEERGEKGSLSTPYDPTLDLSGYRKPDIDLLQDHEIDRVEVTRAELEENKNKIVDTLESFQIGIDSIRATIGPTVTLYEIIPKAGVKISKIRNLEDDIALNLAALGIRIIAPIPGRGTIGIEVPNKNRQLVGMKALLATEKFRSTKMELPVVLGKTISNEVFMVDLAKMPHLLMAGATGQGKSVGLNVLLTSLLYKKHPAELKFVLVDPKKVELTLYNKIERHFLAMLPDSEEAIITDTKKVVNTLNSLCIEMDDRYNLLKEAGCRNLKEYNAKFLKRELNPEKGHKFLPYIVLVIDELADLMMTAGKEVETPIARLAQLARAIGIHLVLATQRPSVNVITGIIKANFPARLSFRVTSKVDSRVILDGGGAEQLIGMGDMLMSMGSDITRLQCAFIDTAEVDNVCDFIGAQRGYASAYILPEFVGDDGDQKPGDVDLADRDDMFEDAARLIVMHQQGSTSLIQRKLKLGYNRAGRLIDQLEAAGVVGPFEGSKAREVLISDEYALEQLLRSLDEKY